VSSAERREKLGHVAGIYAIVDDAPGRRHTPRAVLEAALRGGASAVQLRLKHTSDRDALALARWAVAAAHASGALLIVNDRVDLASLSGADGVHLGTEDLAPERVPHELRRTLLVGLSTHTLDQVRKSRVRPVDYIGFGPVFATPSKASEYSPRGTPLLSRAVRESAVPVVAIGGIDGDNVAEVGRAGVAAAAVISALSEAEAPDRALTTLRRAFAGRG